MSPDLSHTNEDAFPRTGEKPAVGKLPAFQFYPADWRKDAGVQALSYHDRGIWFEILCLMHESERRGVLLLNGKAMPDEALARILGLDNEGLTTWLTTALTYGVASREPATGALMCRRMVRDELKRQKDREAGKKGGNPALVKGGVNQVVNPSPTPGVNQNLTPSSSSSFLNTPPTPKGGDGVVEQQQPKKLKKAKSNLELDPLFVQFWKAYPLKVKKPAAAKAFARHSPTQELLSQMLAAIEAAKRSERWLKEDGAFISHPDSWLNQRRWEDVTPSQTANGSVSQPQLKRASDNPLTFTEQI